MVIKDISPSALANFVSMPDKTVLRLVLFDADGYST